MSKQKEKRPVLRSFFSLVELLVVAAVIALLAGLLLPVLGESREKARRTNCLANLKQLGTAYCAYGQEWNCTVPVKQGPKRWMDLLEDDGVSTPVLRCPADRRSEQDRQKVSYGINQCYPGDPAKRLPRGLWYGIGWNRLKNPADFIAFADGAMYYIGTTVAAPRPGRWKGEAAVIDGYCKYLVFRHDRGERIFNSVFADGHAAGMIFEAVPGKYWDYNHDAYVF